MIYEPYVWQVGAHGLETNGGYTDKVVRPENRTCSRYFASNALLVYATIYTCKGMHNKLGDYTCFMYTFQLAWYLTFFLIMLPLSPPPPPVV